MQLHRQLFLSLVPLPKFKEQEKDIDVVYALQTMWLHSYVAVFKEQEIETPYMYYACQASAHLHGN